MATVAHLLDQAAAQSPDALRGVIAPHAGYVYSGGVAASAFGCVAASGKSFRRVILIGPPHYVGVHGVAAPSARAFATPLGEIPVDQESVRRLAEAGLVRIDDSPHAPEHALEVELPFLQLVLRDFEIVPLLAGDAAPDQVAAIIEAASDDDETLLVVSTDLSHYLDDASARRRDLATAETIEARDFGRLGPYDACGYAALNGALCAAGRNGWGIKRLDLRNSGDVSGDYARVVGYGAWAFAGAASL